MLGWDGGTRNLLSTENTPGQRGEGGISRVPGTEQGPFGLLGRTAAEDASRVHGGQTRVTGARGREHVDWRTSGFPGPAERVEACLS